MEFEFIWNQPWYTVVLGDDALKPAKFKHGFENFIASTYATIICNSSLQHRFENSRNILKTTVNRSKITVKMRRERFT